MVTNRSSLHVSQEVGVTAPQEFVRFIINWHSILLEESFVNSPSTLNPPRLYGHFINGWFTAPSKRLGARFSLADGSPLPRFSSGKAEDFDIAVVARSAFKRENWAATPGSSRAAPLHRFRGLDMPKRRAPYQDRGRRRLSGRRLSRHAVIPAAESAART